ncbi:bifunctional 4-hydroxy-2-oxoglutarate aldolase/2-dehydro-3-deoxy-phosphogluconate aldolase [Streptococcus pantholopis]|uniref:Bifunctional 2-keto-4-hydroxyglutarate aldolase/2-keto-3-deoxy-6-phosphogluconate aldolase n=1 Tax=Streptococcus pantholopis TaxID=1811193 RepID=A0A172Q7F2_9STRE|nr:bifunctional 4-hydroxy-2-oxoglutarate aldolase/2-dehydro-3-deoxy-phosphogluconate aldolase [Streptococcus pantholopis]AND79352.1 bifunctional 2-keto-4-hydroxyglutarate aldolase/2-keto-3-deoxy-6-phosphogluconate aldolase [Streptococcus pantholopis]
MVKSEIITKLIASKIVPVVRGESKEEAVSCSLACIEGGIKSIEVTYTNPYASDVIHQLQSRNDKNCIIGAGTVLDEITARNAILAGAQFIVSPSFNQATAVLCNRYGIPYFPGCMTVTEIVTSLESGVDMVKIFPGDTVGMSFIKAIKAPLPQVMVMVTGGVNMSNIEEWFNAGADVLGIGGEFNKLAHQKKFKMIEDKAADYIKLVSSSKNLAFKHSAGKLTKG